MFYERYLRVNQTKAKVQSNIGCLPSPGLPLNVVSVREAISEGTHTKNSHVTSVSFWPTRAIHPPTVIKWNTIDIPDCLSVTRGTH